MALGRGRRRRRIARDDTDGAGVVGPGLDGGVSQPPLARERPESGPWDFSEIDDDDVDRIDFGSLRVPVDTTLTIRVDLGPTGQPTAVRLLAEGSEMQLGAFAAPRTAGIWDDVRGEIGASLIAEGGKASDAEGPFGTELRALIPAQGGRVPARFIGFDGPRWFLRAMLVGAAVIRPDRAEPFEAVLRDLVVVRGHDPMPVKDPLPIVMPEVAEASAEDVAAEEVDADELPDAEPIDQEPQD